MKNLDYKSQYLLLLLYVKRIQKRFLHLKLQKTDYYYMLKSNHVLELPKYLHITIRPVYSALKIHANFLS